MLVPEAGELHEDDAAIRLAAAVAGPGLTVRGPAQSRVDLLAEAPGVLNVRVAELERLNRIDPLEVFTAFDGQVVEQGDLVASVKIAPHLVDAATVDAGARLAGFGSHPIVWVAPFLPEPGRGHRQGIGPRDGARQVRGQRPGQDRGSRLGDRRHRLRRGRRRGGRGRDGRLRPPARTRST